MLSIVVPVTLGPPADGCPPSTSAFASAALARCRTEGVLSVSQVAGPVQSAQPEAWGTAGAARISEDCGSARIGFVEGARRARPQKCSGDWRSADHEGPANRHWRENVGG